jgi:uncharacterized membrane protein
VPDVHESIEIERDAGSVFAYVTDLPRQPEWQDTVTDVRVEGDGPVRVGTRVHETRRSPAGSQTISYSVTELGDGVYAFEGGGGPVRVAARIAVEPLGESSCRVTASFTFSAGLAGKLFLPLLRREANAHVPEDMRRLKAIMEGRA